MEPTKLPPAGGLALLAMVGVLCFGGTAVPPTAAGAAAADQIVLQKLGNGLPDEHDSLEKAICGHFGTSVKQLGDCLQTAACEQTLPIIATVPNPDEGYLALYFDRWVESIERAVTDTGYSFDRQWLPWKTEPASAELNPVLRLALEAQRKRIANEPGLLLFRRAPPGASNSGGADSPSLVAVLLVGETTTSGINLQQFRKAQEQSRALCPQCPVRILGPSFSGSFNSLARALKDQSGTVQVISGAATNGDAAREFQELCPRASYGATLHTDGVAVRAFRDHVRKKWSFDGRIALITEDGTRYGSDFATEWRKDNQNEDILSIRFPQEIARLRNASEGAETTAPKALTLPREFRPFDMRTERPRRDAVPDFAKKQTPVSQEAAMNALAASLRRERIKLAVVVATDVLDLLFVTRFLRIAAPDIRIVLFDSDLLIARAAETMPLQGVLNVTTYPLFLRNQHRTDEERQAQPPRRVLFPSRYAQGVYNACRALLLNRAARSGGVSSWSKSLSVPAAEGEEEMLEYSSPQGEANHSVVPALWLMVAGRGGFWPVELLKPEADKNLLPSGLFYCKNQTGVPPESQSLSVYLLGLLITGVSLVFVVAVWQANSAKGSLPAWCSFAALPCQTRKGRISRVFFLLMLSLALLAVHLTASAPLWMYSVRAPSSKSVAVPVALSAVAAALLIAVSIVLLARFVRSGSLLRPGIRVYLLLLSLSGGFIGCSAFWVYRYLHAPAAGDFILYRSLHMASGVSPAFPVLLLLSLVAYGCWIHLRRVVLYWEVDPHLPDLAEAALCPSLAYLRQRLGNVLRAPLYNARETSAAALLTGAAALACAYWQRLQTFEPYHFNWLVTALSGIGFLLLSLALLRALYIWRTLRLILEQMERHPLRHAFSRLPRHQAWSPLGQPGVTKRTHNVIVRSLDTLRALHSCLGAWPLKGEIKGAIDASEGPIKRILKAVAHRQREPLKETETLRRCYRKMANRLCQELEKEEWVHGTSQSLEAAQAKDTPPRYTAAELAVRKPVLLAEEFVALRVVAWLRYVLRHIRNLFEFLVVGFVLFVLALHSYPFQSERVIDHVTVGLFLVLGTGMVLILAQLDRDAILSRITNTTAGKLDRTFYFRVISYGALPALTVIASQFPSVGQALYAAVQPALEALR